MDDYAGAVNVEGGRCFRFLIDPGGKPVPDARRPSLVNVTCRLNYQPYAMGVRQAATGQAGGIVPEAPGSKPRLVQPKPNAVSVAQYAAGAVRSTKVDDARAGRRGHSGSHMLWKSAASQQELHWQHCSFITVGGEQPARR